MSQLVATVVERARLLGLTPGGLALLAGDLFVLLAVAGTMVRRLRVARRSTPRELLAVALIALALVVLPATALGALGWLSNRSLLLSHLLLLACTAALERKAGGRAALSRVAGTPALLVLSLVRVPGSLCRAGAWSKRRRFESGLLAAILVVLGFYALLAIGTLPLGYDAQTYRLSRVALWLQEGSIAHFPTNELRQNFVGQNGDLVLLWLISFFRIGYPLVQMCQYLAGLIACGAVYELGALFGWRRVWRLAAVGALLGAPTATIQFFSVQTDLFVGGTLAAAVLFALAALRSGRIESWLLAGVGAGLAIGTKVTAFILGPSVVLLLVAFAVVERVSWRRAARGAASALVPALLLCGFNFAQNLDSYGNLFGPARFVGAMQGGVAEARTSSTGRNLMRIAWQVLEPGSNPLVPEAIRAPLVEQLSTVFESDAKAPRWLEWSRRMIDGGLDEDHASFGLIWLLAVLSGGTLASVRALRRPNRREFLGVAMFAAFVTYLIVFARFSTMHVHQFRYFTAAVPIGALAATAGLVAVRGRFGRMVIGLLLASHLLNAALVGARSEYQGLSSLLEPRSSIHYPLWRERRALVESLGDSPLKIGLTPQFDGWVAPYLRTRPSHRYRVVPRKELAELASLSELFVRNDEDLLIAAPGALERFALDDVAVRPFLYSEWAPQLAIGPLGPGEQARPAIVSISGLLGDGWTNLRLRLELAAWSTGRLELRLRNPTALSRRVEVQSSVERQTFELAPRAPFDLRVAVAARDTVAIEIEPSFVPAERDPNSTDARRLGLLFEPSAVVAENGVFGDGWTASRASLALENWLSGGIEIAVDNPTPLQRSFRVAGRHAERSIDLAPFGRAVVSLPVLPRDRLRLEVDPPFVPTAHDPSSGDLRELGVLLGADLLHSPSPGEFR